MRQFRDRSEAGQELGAALCALGLADPVVYALPRGGVAVGAEVAAALGAPLDVVLVRKMGAPGRPELAMGAVVDGASPETVLNDAVITRTGATAEDIGRAKAAALAQIERRRPMYAAGREAIDPYERCAIVVDDGLATGATALAALQAIRRQGPRELILAVPVGPRAALRSMRAISDRVVCLVESDLPLGVGGF